MAMLDVVSCPLTGGFMAQVGRLGPKFASHMVLLCIQRMNRVNSRNDNGTINIVLVLLLLLLLLL